MTSSPTLTAPLAELNAQYARPSVSFVEGHGGLPFIQVNNSQADALISIYAGQVLAFKPKQTTELLFVSEKAYYQPGKAIKGGVPICWPWFGADPQGLGRAAHGFVRNRAWQVAATGETAEGATQVTLCLTDSPDTQAIWPYPFKLTLEITVGSSLRLALSTENTGPTDFVITQALHTYFAVGDITQVQITGLENTPYIDKAAAGQGAIKQQIGAVTVSEEVDRIYTQAPATLRIVDAALQRTIQIDSIGNQSAVVWNPWEKITAGMADLKADDYLRFVCVETTNAADDSVTIPAGQIRQLIAEYTVI